MGAPGLNELKNKFALTPSSQTSSSGASLQVQLSPSILCTEGGPLAKFLGIVCPLMRGCLLNISLHHTWKLPTKIDSSSKSLRADFITWLQFAIGEKLQDLQRRQKGNEWCDSRTKWHLMGILCFHRFSGSIREYAKATPKVPLSSCSGWNSLIWSSWRITVEWLLLSVSSKPFPC